MIFKVTDVRIQTAGSGTPKVYIDGLGTGQDISAQVTAVRAALMLEVFLSGRDCYWDTGAQVFATMPVPSGPPTAAAHGEISSWEVRVPLTATLKIEFFVRLLGGGPNPPTSGDAAINSLALSATEEQAAVILAILRSPYRAYRQSPSMGNVVRNTEVVSYAGW